MCVRVYARARFPYSHNALKYTSDVVNVLQTARFSYYYHCSVIVNPVQREKYDFRFIRNFVIPVKRIYPTAFALEDIVRRKTRLSCFVSHDYGNV